MRKRESRDHLVEVAAMNDPDLARELLRQYASALGRKGAAVANAKRSRSERSALARRAVKVRWRRWRAARRGGA